jgi:transposase
MYNELEIIRIIAHPNDNAPCHKTNLIMGFLNANRIPTLDLPPQSPDLNPIENLWAIVKRRRFKRFGIPSTKNELIEQIFAIWEEIDQELLDTRFSMLLDVVR